MIAREQEKLVTIGRRYPFRYSSNMGEPGYIERTVPLFTPPRDTLLKYGVAAPGETSEGWNARLAQESKVANEASRRFSITLQDLQNNNQMFKDPDVYRLPSGDEEYVSFHLDEGHGWTPVIEGIKHDRVAMHILQNITAKRVAVNQFLDQYAADSEVLSIPKGDSVRRAVISKYNLNVERIVSNQLQKKGNAQFVSKQDAASRKSERYDEYTGQRRVSLQDTSFHPSDWITSEHYLKIANAIAGSCRSNSYLENLFQVFAGGAERSHLAIAVPYPKRFYEARKEMGPINIDPRIIEIERKAHEHIRRLYKAFTPEDTVNLPDILYILRGEQELFEAKTGYKLSAESGRVGGRYIGAITEGGQEIRMNIPLVVIDANVHAIDNGRAAFHELYHASGISQDEGSLRLSAFGSSVIEEGLTQLEEKRFIDEHYKEEASEEGTIRHAIAQYKSGVRTSLPPIPSMIDMQLLSRVVTACGGDDFLVLLRQARTGDQGAVENVQKIIDEQFGQGSYSLLRATPGHSKDRIQGLKQKFGFENQPEKAA